MKAGSSQKKKLLLILPKSDRGYWGKVHHGKAGLVRLSLPTVAALTPEDWDVEIHDVRVTPVNFDRSVDLVGLTSSTTEIINTYELADHFRGKGVPVVIGGVHVSALPEEGLKHADAIVIGEAEYVWKKLLNDLEQGRLQRTYRAEKYCDMQNNVIVRRDLVDRSMYSGYFTLEATRGCPFDCDYCSVTGVFGRKYRTRPIGQVIDEIRGFDSRDFFFVDDNICGRPAYSKKLFKALIPLKKSWGSQTSITIAKDPELCELYAKSGGRYAFIGFETILEQNLTAINKSWNKVDLYGEAIKTIHDAGINIVGSFILGLDGDDPHIFQRTLDFIMQHKIDSAQFHILTPLPGTRLYDSMQAAGRITSSDWSRFHTSEVVFKPKGMTAQQLQDGYHWIFRETNNIPNILKRVFRSPRGIKYRIIMNISYRNKAKRMPAAKNPANP